MNVRECTSSESSLLLFIDKFRLQDVIIIMLHNNFAITVSTVEKITSFEVRLYF